MMEKIILNGRWQVLEEPLDSQSDRASVVSTTDEGWMPAPVPGDVRQALLADGYIDEPLDGIFSFDQHWIEDRSWWFRKVFSLAPELHHARAIELEMHGLDCHASIFLNGRHLGDHPSAFRPFVAEVKNELLDECNVLLVRLTTGAERIRMDLPDELGGIVVTEAMRGDMHRGDRRRVYLRKPQFSWGWDWSPRTATVGITGDVTLRSIREAALRDVQLRPCMIGRRTSISIETWVQWMDCWKEGDVAIDVSVTDPDGSPVTGDSWKGAVVSGYNRVDFQISIPSARLWWPAGMGVPDRYKITVELRYGGELIDSREIDYGIRFVELVKGDPFMFRINGRNVFCRGANWVPPDALYARASDDKYRRLVAQAAAANINMLRVWGGGLYERHAFYDACDKHGIMVWQDFMFACSPYPDDREDFRIEVAREADYQTRRLGNHACVVLWCGGNELLASMSGRWGGKPTDSGCVIMNDILPHAVGRNCPHIPYWPDSPFGGKDFWNSPTGDSHVWQWSMNEDVNQRVVPECYDTCEAQFVSEFGHVGPCSLETTKRYLATAEPQRDDEVWRHHANTFERGTVDAGIEREYRDAQGLGVEDYLYYGGLFQGVMLGYSLESLRAKLQCHGALFWMFNDAWGEIGWSVMDYYLNRKIAWYFARRAFAVRKLMLRRLGDQIALVVANDGPEKLSGVVECGYVSLDGLRSSVRSARLSCHPFSRTRVVTFEPKGDARKGVWFARALDDDEIQPAIFRAGPFRNLEAKTPPEDVDVQLSELERGGFMASVSSERFVHAVSLLLPSQAIAQDNYFDLLPGERRNVLITSPNRLSPEDVHVRTP